MQLVVDNSTVFFLFLPMNCGVFETEAWEL